MVYTTLSKRAPGAVRDAITDALKMWPEGETVDMIHKEVTRRIGYTATSSVRSYLRLNTPRLFERLERGRYTLADRIALREESQPSLILNGKCNGQAPALQPPRTFHFGRSRLILADCVAWLDQQQENSVHAVVTDPPYGLIEYSDHEKAKLRSGRGGVWRIPPSFDGHQRSPLPRFTVLTANDLAALSFFFLRWSEALIRVMVPGAHALVASNPLLSYIVASAGVKAGFERRGEIIRLTMTMRGGDRPKAAHEEFNQVSVMPRSMWEPWLIFRKPLEGRAQDNLRRWKTGGFRRPTTDQPFGDVIPSSPTRASERALAPHPSLKPQAFLRQIVRAVLPLGEGVVLDPFAGSGSTVAAAEAVGYECVGIERDELFFDLACASVPKLTCLTV